MVAVSFYKSFLSIDHIIHSSSQTLAELYLYNTGIETEGIQHITQALKQNTVSFHFYQKTKPISSDRHLPYSI